MQPDKDKLFTDAQRSRIVWEILQRTEYDEFDDVGEETKKKSG